MATRKINTRLVTRNDTYENWSTNNPVLLKGEIAVVTNASQAASCYSVTGSTYIVGNAALKDATGNTIFTANATSDSQITVIDCGSSSEVI